MKTLSVTIDEFEGYPFKTFTDYLCILRGVSDKLNKRKKENSCSVEVISDLMTYETLFVTLSYRDGDDLIELTCRQIYNSDVTVTSDDMLYIEVQVTVKRPKNTNATAVGFAPVICLCVDKNDVTNHRCLVTTNVHNDSKDKETHHYLLQTINQLLRMCCIPASFTVSFSKKTKPITFNHL